MHGWEMPGAHESDCHDAIPISSNSVKCLELPTGPLEGTAKHHALEKQAGFSYCQVLGELIYAYVICHLDIGYASTFLSCFASSPTLEHYMALKNVIKYLCATMHWGLIYWQESPMECFPLVPLEHPYLDPSLPKFPVHDLLCLIGYMDAANATDLKTHHFVTGYAFCLAGGAIAYKSKL